MLLIGGGSRLSVVCVVGLSPASRSAYVRVSTSPVQSCCCCECAVPLDFHSCPTFGCALEVILTFFKSAL